MRGLPTTAAEGAEYDSRAGKPAGVQMAITGGPTTTISSDARAAASVHEDSVDIDHPLSDRTDLGGDIAHSSDEGSQASCRGGGFGLGMGAVAAAPPSSGPSAAGAGGAGRGVSLGRHGVENDTPGTSAVRLTDRDRSYRHGHVYRDGGGRSGSGGGRSVEMVGVMQQGGPGAAAGQEYGVDGSWGEGESEGMDDECGCREGGAQGQQNTWRSRVEGQEIAGRSGAREANLRDPLSDPLIDPLGGGQTLQLRFRGQARGDGTGGGGGGSVSDSGRSPEGSSSGRRLGFVGVQHANEASGGGGLNKTMLSVAATTLSASALAGAYFFATYSKGHRE
ncbi:hypothetical protein DUNSADRAFT_16474 [Dunaliella salina]|uniref:Encoded protein n=1 Tax=Dunaliella salina TaxID=3046 RepID=A0ABQ7H101_DUNSA|nr:hypothetical protein DUNSADRAFT_16474 [Dunaliella salina]|eukprot:KAF5840533.1 hypothetical protein DUNSADRAFT_16474 [Dunaliella salina]